MNEDFFAIEYRRFFIGLISEMDFFCMVSLITMKYATHFSYIFPVKICKKTNAFWFELSVSLQENFYMYSQKNS